MKNFSEAPEFSLVLSASPFIFKKFIAINENKSHPYFAGSQYLLYTHIYKYTAVTQLCHSFFS